jgi:zinc/manganese transport system ATP-binding protein
MSAAVSVRGAAVAVGGQLVWSDVDLDVAPGEFAAVLGPNGSGKSTLLKAVLGLLALRAGTITVLGARAGERNRDIGYLPQRHGFGAEVRIRGADLVRLGLDGARYGVRLPFTSANRAARARVDEVIELVGAAPYAERPIGELSGGEQQRLLIAQALVRRPRLLLLDEPLDSLDLPNQVAVAALIQQVCRSEGVSVMLVAHDVNPLLGYLDRVIYLAGGHALQGTVAEVITSENLSAMFHTPIEVLETSDGRLVVVGEPEAPHHHGHRH